LYLAACFTPAINVDDGIPKSDLDFRDGSPIGLVILLFGWTGGNNGIPWSANVFLGLGWVALLARQHRAAFVLGTIASALGLTTWWVWGYGRVLLGYYLWQASLMLLAAGGWAAWRRIQSRKNEPNQALRQAARAATGSGVYSSLGPPPLLGAVVRRRRDTVQYPATILWRVGEEFTVSSSTELLRILGRFERDSLSNAWPLLAQVIDRDGHGIVVGIAKEGAFFEFTSKEIEDSLHYRDFVCVGDENAEGVVSFWLCSHHSELKRSNLIDVGAMKDALLHYLETGELSLQIKWLDCGN
jgi:hypothetical protein